LVVRGVGGEAHRPVELCRRSLNCAPRLFIALRRGRVDRNRRRLEFSLLGALAALARNATQAGVLQQSARIAVVRNADLVVSGVPIDAVWISQAGIGAADTA